MTVLVTGGCGYIGSHVVRQLTETGTKVIVYDNLSTGSPEALLYGEPLVVGELADSARVEKVIKLHGCSTVMHFAASIVAPESVGNPVKYYGNNTCTTLKLFEACVRSGVQRIVFSSTAAVYGVSQSGSASEEDATQPISPYGRSKLMSEWMLRDVGLAHNIRHVVLRYFNVAGADPLTRMGQRTPDATHLIKVCCQAAMGLRPQVSIFGTDYATSDGTGVRDYIHVEDLASAHLSALRYLQQGGGSTTINVGYGRGASVREVIATVASVTGRKIVVHEAPRRPGDPGSLIACVDRARKILDWVPQHDKLHKIVSDAWNWELYLQNQFPSSIGLTPAIPQLAACPLD